jgi:putative FmdB family regulatory protein
MPLYEFRCVKCGAEFEKLVRSATADKVTCPACGGSEVEQQFSSFASRAGTPSGSGGSSGCKPSGG